MAGVGVFTPTPAFDPSNGTITLQRGCGLTIRLRAQGGAQAFIDISGWDLWFVVEGQPPLALVPGADRTEQLIVITPAITDALPARKPLNYLIRDETNPQFLSRGAGLIIVKGFTSTP